MSRLSMVYWRKFQTSTSSGYLAMSHLTNSCWNHIQRSTSATSLAMLHLPNSDWTNIQRSTFEGCLAMSHLPNFDWTNLQKSAVWRLLGNLTPAKLCSKSPSKVKVLRLLSNDMPANSKFRSCTWASETTVFTALKSTAVSLVVVSFSMTLWKLLTTSQKCIRWMTKLISSFCTCCSSGLEPSRILQPDISSNFLPGFRPIFSEMYVYTCSTVGIIINLQLKCLSIQSLDAQWSQFHSWFSRRTCLHNTPPQIWSCNYLPGKLHSRKRVWNTMLPSFQRIRF